MPVGMTPGPFNLEVLLHAPVKRQAVQKGVLPQLCKVLNHCVNCQCGILDIGDAVSTQVAAKKTFRKWPLMIPLCGGHFGLSTV